MKTVIYTRCSTVQQDHLHQVLALEDYAKRNNLNVVRVFKETISGTTDAKTRPEFSKLLDTLKKDPSIKKVLVRELSRLGRDARQIKNTIEDLAAIGVSVYILNMNLETLNIDGNKDPIASLILAILAELAEMERATIIERSRSGLLASAKSGRAGGGVLLAYGYRRGQNKELLIDEEESEIIRLIFKLLLEGNGTGKIADKLNELKVPTRTSLVLRETKKDGKPYKFKEGKWAGNTVLSIINRTDYYGQRKFKREILPCPQIIDKETWDKAQVQLRANYNENSRNTTHFYLLKGLLKCGCRNCGRNYVGKRRSDGSENYYHCSSKLRGVEACKNRGVGIYDLNSAVWFMLKYSDEVKEYARINLMNENEEEKLNSMRNELSIQVSQISKKKKEIEKLIDLYMDGITTKSQVQNKMTKLEKDMSLLKRQERKMITNISTIENTFMESEKSKKVLEFIDLLDTSELKIQQILKTLLLKIVVLNEPDRTACGVSIYFKGVDYTRRSPFSFWVDSKNKTTGLTDIEEYSYAHCMLTF
jgi:site-specific DNA recombinase